METLDEAGSTTQVALPDLRDEGYVRGITIQEGTGSDAKSISPSPICNTFAADTSGIGQMEVIHHGG